MTHIVGIYGASGAGRGIAPLAKAQFADDADIVFIDDAISNAMVNGYHAMNWESFIQLPQDKSVAIAIADSQIREKLAQKCKAANIGFVTVKAQNIVVMDDVVIGEGAILSPFVCITSNIIIGKHFHANISSIVEHDCVIGDFVTFAPGVRCNGNIHIADHAYIGAGAIIKQGTSDKPLKIGKNAVVGMGAVVTKNVPDGAVVVGNPARPLER